MIMVNNNVAIFTERCETVIFLCREHCRQSKIDRINCTCIILCYTVGIVLTLGAHAHESYKLLYSVCLSV